MHKMILIMGMLSITFCDSYDRKDQQRNTDTISGKWIVTSLIHPKSSPIGTFFEASSNGSFYAESSNGHSNEFTLIKKYTTQYVYKVTRELKNSYNSVNYYSIMIYDNIAYISNLFLKEAEVHDFVQSGQIPINEFAQRYEL